MRVIGGRLGGRDLGTVPEGVRPTSDRVRESIFSILGSIEGKRVLDLFAGTGALGLEAYSRGASHVVFVERSRRVAHALRKRIRSLVLAESADEWTLVNTEAVKAIRRLAQDAKADRSATFDLVFMDPPYEQGDRVGTLEALFAHSLLSEDGVVVVEGPKRHPLPPVVGGRVVDERRYGETLLTWLAPTNPADDRRRNEST
jgi:16S rRNA (guanine966-N2)-methyltransferase